MTVVADDEFDVLNTVYLRKIATADVIGEVSGLPPGEVAALVDRAMAGHRLEDVGGMLMLSESGTLDILTAYRDRYGALRTEPDILGWYERFEGLNRQFLKAVSAWQTAGDADPGRLDRLLRVVDRLVTSLSTIESAVPRYGRYAERLRAALDRIEHGSAEYVTSPGVDSVHNIWFEFHEDILTVIGRPRDVAEASG
jgi:hypothetical protein